MRTTRRGLTVAALIGVGSAALLLIGLVAASAASGHQRPSPTQTQPDDINGHVEEEDPQSSSELRARLEASGSPDPGATVTVSTTVTINRQTGERSRGLSLWSYAIVTQPVADLSDCQRLGDLARRVIDIVGGISTPAVGRTPGLSLTFAAGSDRRTVVYNSAEIPALSGTSLNGTELLRRGRYLPNTPDAWACFP